MLYKTETHMHVSEVSRCAHLSAKEMAKLYHAAGYSTLFISDHMSGRYFERYGDIPWKDKVARNFEGFSALRDAAADYGMTVLPSAELQLNCSVNHFLLYGFDMDFFHFTGLFDMTQEQLYRYAQERRVTVVQAHPLRDMENVPAPLCADALEAFNTNPRHDNHTARVLEIAKRHGLPVTSGSDAHRTEDAARGGVISETRIESAEDYVRLMMSGKLRFMNGDETV